MGVRPGGSSSSTLTSRSPYTVIAAVRGIGVAVMTSTSGTAVPALSRNAARCSTPKRCCSSTTTTPRLWNATPSWIRAWVPMTRSTVPSASPPSTRRRSAPVTRLVSSSTLSGRSPNRLPGGHEQSGEQPADARDVLFGEHLRRRHQRPLVPALHGGEQRRDSDDGLPRADVALQQPVHRMGRREVGVDLPDHPLLRGGQREAQRGVEPADELATGLVTDADGVALHRPFAHHEHQLDPQQLVERQTAPGPLLVVERLGQVDVVQRGAAVDQPEAATDGPRDGVVHAPLPGALEGVLDPSGKLPRVELGLLALRIDRDDAPRAVADQVDDRVGHLQPAAVRVDLAVQGDVAAPA